MSDPANVVFVTLFGVACPKHRSHATGNKTLPYMISIAPVYKKYVIGVGSETYH